MKTDDDDDGDKENAGKSTSENGQTLCICEDIFRLKRYESAFLFPLKSN